MGEGAGRLMTAFIPDREYCEICGIPVIRALQPNGMDYMFVEFYSHPEGKWCLIRQTVLDAELFDELPQAILATKAPSLVRYTAHRNCDGKKPRWPKLPGRTIKL